MIISTYRLSMFGDFKQFAPTSTNTVQWTLMFQKAGYELLPSVTTNEPLQPFFASPPQPSEKQLQFTSQDGKTIVRLLSNRVDVELSPGNIDETKDYFDELYRRAISLTKVMLESLEGVRGTRLAYYTDILIPEVETHQFQSFYKRNSLNLESSQEGSYVEWRYHFNVSMLTQLCRKKRAIQF